MVDQTLYVNIKIAKFLSSNSISDFIAIMAPEETGRHRLESGGLVN